MCDLRALADELSDCFRAAPEPVWVSVHRPLRAGDAPEIRVVPEPLGWSGTRSCVAVGMLGDGTVRRTVRADFRPAAGEPTPGRARVVCVVDRHGGVAQRTLIDDGTSLSGAPEGGLALDVLRRMLGLPTDPPACSTDPFLASAWLLGVRRGARPHRRMGWPEVLRLHPVALSLAAVEEDWSDDELQRAILQAEGCGWTWESLREASARLSTPEDPAASLAAWMDVGLFSRWALHNVPPAEQLLESLVHAVSPDARRRAQRLLGTLGAGARRGSRQDTR